MRYICDLLILLCYNDIFLNNLSYFIFVFSQVIKLIVQRPRDFEFRAGEYVYLNIPRVARHEWHPFTISSAPEQEGMASLYLIICT